MSQKSRANIIYEILSYENSGYSENFLITCTDLFLHQRLMELRDADALEINI